MKNYKNKVLYCKPGGFVEFSFCIVCGETEDSYILAESWNGSLAYIKILKRTIDLTEFQILG